jgi:transcription termination factor Rho
MPRSSVREDLLRRLRDHLAVAETHAPEESPLDVRSVAAELGVSPTTLYKYGFNREINAAEQRQREDVHVSGREIERRSFHDQVQGMSQELEKERERNKALVARIAIMEANAARLGFDPEEMYKPILKPVRTVSRAGAIRGTGRRGKGRF